MKKLICIALLVPTLTLAEITPPRGTFDARVRVVDYNPADVVKINTFYGVSTHIQFGKGESINDVAVGDQAAWEISDRGSNLFVKPKATKADTNVTVVTSKRVYQFAFVVEPRNTRDTAAWRDQNLVYSLSFRYPDEEAAKLQSQAQAGEVKKRLDDIKGRLTGAKAHDENRDYWVSGSEDVSPTAARDDGRFIYLTFGNNRDMPAVYSTDAVGNEALVGTSVEGRDVVVPRMVRKLVLRKGNAVACVVNKSFDINGGKDNTTGTVAPDVERVIKGGQ